MPPAKPTTTMRPSNAMHLVEASNAVAADRVEDDVGAVAAGRGLDSGDEVVDAAHEHDLGARLAGHRGLGVATRRRR